MLANYQQIITNSQTRFGTDVEQAMKCAANRLEVYGGSSDGIFAHRSAVAITRACFGRSIDHPEYLAILCPGCEDIRLKCLGVDAIE